MNDGAVKVVQAKWLEKLPPLRATTCLAILAAALLVAFLPVTAAAYFLHGPASIAASATAAGVCWLGASLALLGTNWFGRSVPSGPMYTLALGMVFNCALPFCVGFGLYRSGGPLAQAGVFGLTLVFFQITLVVETLLSLCLLKAPR